LPLKVEIHASAYAFTCPSIADSLKAINYTTFYSYKIINRSTNAYDSVYVGSWVDYDLGNANDDFPESYPSGNAGVVYNGDYQDETNTGYGWKPPTISQVILNGPIAAPNDNIDNDNDSTVDEAGEKNFNDKFGLLSK